MIYLDYNATAPYSESVKAYIQNEMINNWANPSSEHDAGFELANKIKTCRSNIADFLGVSTKTLFFTSSATESINTVLSIETLNKNNIKTIVTSKLEHHATLDQCEWLSKNGFKIEFINNDLSGELDLVHLQDLLSENTNALVSILYVNNETGVINEVEKISKICRENSAMIHIDAVQALGKLEFDLDILDVDFASFAGHKVGAMKGVGLLYAQDIKNLSALIHGGGQERSMRPGTLNFSAIKSFDLALQDISFEQNSELRALTNKLESELLSLPNIKINCSQQKRVWNTVNVYLGGLDARAALLKLSRENIMVSTGSACSSGSYEPSHVITALGRDRDYASSCLRISIGKEISNEQIGKVISAIKNLISV